MHKIILIVSQLLNRKKYLVNVKVAIEKVVIFHYRLLLLNINIIILIITIIIIV